MWKWFKWVLLGLVIIILAGVIYAYWYYAFHLKLTGEVLSAAEKALNAGITIQDPKDDFVIMGKNDEKVDPENNPSPYRLPIFDIKSVSYGADSNYFYYKVIFYDTLPDKAPSVDGDKILAIGSKVGVLSEKIQLSELFTGSGWVPPIGFPNLNTYYFWGPTGIEWPESARYTHQDRDSKISGGAGTDYVMGAFPLEKAALKIGQEAHLSFMMEAKSGKFTHAAVDVLRGDGKMSAVVNWIVGTKVFTVDDDSDLQKKAL